MTATEHVILVDENDDPIGVAEKLQAHKENLRHRAFSVFIFRKAEEWLLLLQQRADNKYHSGGLWTNTCCSHPRPGEDIIAAGERRLREEMGLDVALSSIGWFHYIAPFGNGLTENENDHVLIGVTGREDLALNPEEAQGSRWVSIGELKRELDEKPERFTAWFREAFELVEGNLDRLRACL